MPGLAGAPAVAAPPIAGASPPVAPPPAPQDPFVSELARRGFQGVASREEGERRLLEFVDLQLRRQQSAQQSRPTQTGVQTQVTAQQPATAAAPAQRHWWDEPPIDQGLVQQYLRVNDNGEHYWLTGTPAEVQQQGEAYIAHRERVAARWAREPAKMLEEREAFTREETFRLWEERQAQREQERQEQQFFASIDQKHPYLFATDPLTGRPDRNRFSEIGERVDHYMQQAELAGVSNPVMALEFALAMYQQNHGPITQAAAPQAAPAAPPPAAAPTPDQIRQQLAAASLPPRAGYAPAAPAAPATSPYLPPPAQLAAPGLSAREVAQLALRRNGIMVGH